MFRRTSVTLLLSLFALAACGEEEGDGGSGGGGGGAARCGDGVRAGAEVCDGRDFAGASCEALGFGPGALACRPDCSALELTGCGAPATCGSGGKDGLEPCDGADLGGQSCASLGLGAGTLACNASCTGFDLAACAGAANCGDGTIDGAEVCDGAALGGQSCEGRGFDGGTLACAAGCLSFDTSGCTSACVQQCGERNCGVDPACGLPCGSCGPEDQCNADGRCEPSPACRETEAICAGGRCVQNVLPVLAEVGGRVSWDGVRIPNQYPSDPEWQLIFVEETTRLEYYVQLDGGRDAYTLRIMPGTYDVFFTFRFDDTLPTQVEGRVPIAANYAVNPGQNVLNVLPVLAEVGGRVSWDGVRIPNQYPSDPEWQLIFVEEETRLEYYVQLDGGRDAYTLRLMPGTYDVFFTFRFDDTLPTQVEGRVPIAANYAVNPGQNVLNVLPVLAEVGGRVSWDGVRIPNQYPSDPEWQLIFVEEETRLEYYVQLDGGRDAYTLRLMPGTYDVFFNFRFDDTLPTQVEGRVPIAANYAVNPGQNVLNVLPVLAEVGGRVSWDGVRIPNQYPSDPEWQLIFVEETSRLEYYIQLDGGRDAYTTRIMPGTYDVFFNFRFDDTLPTQIEGRVPIAANHAVNPGQNVLNVLPVLAEVGGRVSWDGVRIPNQYPSDPEWQLIFVEEETRLEYFVQLDGGRDAYTLRIMPGTYDVFFNFRFDDTLPTQIEGRVPIAANYAVNPGQNVLNVLPTLLEIGGRVAWDGVRIPNQYPSDPEWQLIFVEADSRLEYYIQLDGGRDAYTTRIMPGVYDLFFNFRFDDTLPTQVEGRIPIASCIELR